MSEIPCWWLILSGVYFSIIILLCICSLVLVAYFFKILKKLVDDLSLLTPKLHQIIDKTDSILEETNSVLKDSSEPLKGIVKNIDNIVAMIAGLLEKGAMILLTANTFKNIFSFFRKKKTTDD